MNASTTGSPDGNSDYGSDVTPEEEEILTRFLFQSSLPKPILDIDLLPADIENDENPHAPRLSHHAGYRSQERNRHFVQRRGEGKRQISIGIERDASSSVNGKLHLMLAWQV